MTARPWELKLVSIMGKNHGLARPRCLACKGCQARPKAAQAAGEGTGLGLSISHDTIVKQHGGSIEVDTRPGEFTEIRVILPRSAPLLPERP
jgi:signal transduction histidine kinase